MWCIYDANVGILNDKLIRNNLCDNLVNITNPIVKSLEVQNRSTIDELKIISESFETDNLQPVILKDVSFWGSLYHGLGTRKVFDIDIFLKNTNDFFNFCNILKKNNYIFNKDELIQQWKRNDYYSTDLVKKRVHKVVTPEQYEAIRFVKEKHLDPINKLELVDYRNVDVWIEIEIHNSLFLFADGRKLDEKMLFTDWIINDRYLHLEPWQNIPYLAEKIYNDTSYRKPEVFKLFSDFICILETSSKDELEKGLNLAVKWGVIDKVLNAISLLGDFVPEVDFIGLTGRDTTSFSSIFDSIYQNEATYD